VEYATILTEVAAAVADQMRRAPGQFGADTETTLRAAGSATAVEYLRAQQLRTRLADAFAEVFASVDVLATPATACTAPPVTADAIRDGLVDEALGTRLTSYTFPASLVGLPATSVPVGVDRWGLPVGLQLVGPPGGEATVLRMAAHFEAHGLAIPPPSRVWHVPVRQP
jgi:aspartyl-tRNA(Asn)/glutamyl-tRNA(Gln) amidotransferase subunit A